MQKLRFRDKLRCLQLLILMALVAYVLCEESGIANARPIPVPEPTLERTYVITETIYQISLLKDTSHKEIKILEPPIKKKYLDSLEYIGTSELIFEGKLTEKFVNGVMLDLAKGVGANVIIIDNHDSRRITVTRGIFGIGGF